MNKSIVMPDQLALIDVSRAILSLGMRACRLTGTSLLISVILVVYAAMSYAEITCCFK